MTLVCRACGSYALGEAAGTHLFGRATLRFNCLDCGAGGAVREQQGEIRLSGRLADDGERVSVPEEVRR